MNGRFRPSVGGLGSGALRELVFELDDAFLLGMDDALEVFVLLDDRAAVVAGQVGAGGVVAGGNRRVRGLHQRTLADGTTVYESRLRVDGRDRWMVLEAKTKTDAIHEHDGMRVDRQRGEIRHDQLSPTVAEVWPDLVAHMHARVGITDKRRCYAQGTVDLYEQRLRDHVSPVLGAKRIGEVATDDVQRLVDVLTRKGLAPGTITSVINIVSRLFRYAIKRKLVPQTPSAISTVTIVPAPSVKASLAT